MPAANAKKMIKPALNVADGVHKWHLYHLN
jgi:hypothetical protein